jgi:hypothetical protein
VENAVINAGRGKKEDAKVFSYSGGYPRVGVIRKLAESLNISKGSNCAVIGTFWDRHLFFPDFGWKIKLVPAKAGNC